MYTCAFNVYFTLPCGQLNIKELTAHVYMYLLETQCATFFLLIDQNVLNYFNCHEFVYIYINYLHTDKIRLLCIKHETYKWIIDVRFS
jgi:hypothetical protein